MATFYIKLCHVLDGNKLTVLPATRQWGLFRLYSSRSWYSM